MVHRAALLKMSSQPETKKSHHVKLEQDARNKGEADLKKKKMKLERSIRAADLESFEDSPTVAAREKKQPNYMKSTSCWDAKKEQQLQVTTTSHPKIQTDKKRATRPLVMNLKKGVVVNRATCSSTLKEMKFPEALDISPEGISVMRVCPYVYCSLNGHRHEALPPLKSFVSARRKLLKTQKSLKLKRLPSLRAKIVRKDEEEVDTGQTPDDFVVEIYDSNPAEDDLSSELSSEEADVLVSFLEYVECDYQSVVYAEEEKQLSLEPENELSTFDFNWEEEVDSPVLGSLISLEAHDVAEADEELQQEECHKVAEIIDVVTPDFGNPEGNDVDSDEEEEEESRVDVFHQETESSENVGHDILKSDGPEEQQNLLEENITEEDDPIGNQPETVFECADEDEEAEISYDIKICNCEGQSLESENEQHEGVDIDGSIPELKSRMRITKKKIPEAPDGIREFNPRSPRFLDLEPDPEAEKVDLRHQLMDERKNSEEYLIDHALQRALMKLGSAQKRKVALLVQAFEIVTPPLPVYEKPLQHETSAFMQARIMQACS